MISPETSILDNKTLQNVPLKYDKIEARVQDR